MLYTNHLQISQFEKFLSLISSWLLSKSLLGYSNRSAASKDVLLSSRVHGFVILAHYPVRSIASYLSVRCLN